MKFINQKNGYNTKEVDEYLIKLSEENEKIINDKNNEINELKKQLEDFQKRSNSITLALTAAVDKAKEIEESSKNIYKLKIEQLTLLYTKWEMLLNEILKKYPNVSSVSNMKSQMLELRNSINDALKDDFNVEIMKTNPATDPIKSLLVKLTSKKAINNEKAKIHISRNIKESINDKTELFKLEERAKNIKPITNINLNKDEKYENLVDKFLDDDELIESNVFEKAISKFNELKPNETGFDLNECVNPTEDLNEIMKSFDFYNEAN